MPRFLSPFHSSAAIRKSGVLQDPLVAWSPASCASSQHVRKVTSLQDREELWASVVCEMKPDPSVYCPWHTRMVGPAWSLRLRTRSVWLPPLCCILCWALPHTPATKEAQMPHFCVTPGRCCQSTDRIKLPRAQAQDGWCWPNLIFLPLHMSTFRTSPSTCEGKPKPCDASPFPARTPLDPLHPNYAPDTPNSWLHPRLLKLYTTTCLYSLWSLHPQMPSPILGLSWWLSG